jgi:hypothetical protein
MNLRRIFFEMVLNLIFKNYLCLVSARSILLKPEILIEYFLKWLKNEIKKLFVFG